MAATNEISSEPPEPPEPPEPSGPPEPLEAPRAPRGPRGRRAPPPAAPTGSRVETVSDIVVRTVPPRAGTTSPIREISEPLRGFGRHLVEPLGQSVPTQGRALDTNRELHDALERSQLAQLVQVDLLGFAVDHLGAGAVTIAISDPIRAEVRLVDRHHPFEGRDQSAHLVDRLALDGSGHQRGG